MSRISYITSFLFILSAEAFALNVNTIVDKIFNADDELAQWPLYKRQQGCFYAGYTHAALMAIKEAQGQYRVGHKAERKINKAIQKTDIQNKKCFSSNASFLQLGHPAKKVEHRIDKANKKLSKALDGIDADASISFDEAKLKNDLLARAKKLPNHSSVDVGLFWAGTWKPDVCYDIGSIKFLAELAVLNAESASVDLNHVLANSIKELQNEICFSNRWTEKYRRERAELIQHLEKYAQE
ncbi:MAG: hypothetical protein JNM93_04465 [Bacteriovoracaceae bacterium]|nr:hypothetical protein [Bacteriovoracaceae bacterium]